MTDLVVIEERETHAVLRINRAEKRNAMNRATRTALRDAMENIRGRFKVVVLTGTDSTFCAGVDLKESAADREQGIGENPYSYWNEVNLAIRRHPAIFIAAVNGTALGGGSTLINICDLAIAANEAQIGMPEMGFATYPGLAGPAAQINLTRKRAAWMILTTKRIDGPTAQAWGLVNLSVPKEELMAEAEALAAHIAQFDAVALTESKRAMDYIPNVISDWRQAFEYGTKVNTLIRSRSNARNESIAKFVRGERNAGQGQQ